MPALEDAERGSLVLGTGISLLLERDGWKRLHAEAAMSEEPADRTEWWRTLGAPDRDQISTRAMGNLSSRRAREPRLGGFPSDDAGYESLEPVHGSRAAACIEMTERGVAGVVC